MTTPLTIDIISDVICPWCYVGKRNFDLALAARPDIDATLRWRPFQLDPSVPPQGVDRRSYLRAKFGDDDRLAAISNSLKQTAAEAGLSLNLEAIALTPNTLDAHRLLHWAGGQGQAHAMAERLGRVRQGGVISAVAVGHRQAALAVMCRG
ncbi:DsbA family oxidoreductase [Parapedomonas caeni]